MPNASAELDERVGTLPGGADVAVCPPTPLALSGGSCDGTALCPGSGVDAEGVGVAACGVVVVGVAGAASAGWPAPSVPVDRMPLVEPDDNPCAPAVAAAHSANAENSAVVRDETIVNSKASLLATMVPRY